MDTMAAKARGARFRLSAHVAFALVLSPLLSAQPQSSPPPDLADASLEDLMNIEVTSVSRKEQKLSNIAAAVYVINQEMIRRSGATNIPDLLRMAPGVDVAQIDANTWAISIRGFNDRYANKVLVLVDGRTVYTPTTSGVYWDQLDVPLEDIERIEVIRGPGGTVWGANAVNGVINIITKSAKDTQGAIVSAGAGSQGAARGLAQYGGEIGEAGTYRVFGDYLNQGNLTASDGRSAAADGWHMLHGGFRSDWTLSPNDSLTVQGDFLETGEGQTINVVFTNQLALQETFNDAISVGSGNALARWNHKLAGGSDTSLQVYFDRYNRHDEGVHEALNTLDVDFQHHLSLGVRHDIVWGAGYRVTADNHTDGYGKMYIPLSRTNSLYSTFIQDEIALAHTLWFTLGSKFEHNAYTGFEYEPSAKLLWQPTQRQAVWVSASRAIVQTSREEADLIVDQYTFPTPGGGFGVAQLQGNPDAKDVYKRQSLTPPRSAGGSWTEAVLYNFPSPAQPQAGLAVGEDGVLYGTTLLGGSSNFGTVFSLTPPSSPAGEWTETVLYSFSSVSYTHLDVYKRQMAPGSRIPCAPPNSIRLSS